MSFLKGHSTRQEIWKGMASTIRASDTSIKESCFNTGSIKIAMNQAIANTGATGHFRIPGASVTNLRILTKPITIHPPDGDTLQTTHMCMLDMPWLPDEARQAHIVPGLTHSSLMSIKMLCNAGYRVEYDNEKCLVNTMTILYGKAYVYRQLACGYCL